MNRTTLLLVLTGFLFIIAFILVILRVISYQNQVATNIQQRQSVVTPLSKVTIGKTKQAEIEKLPRLAKKEQLPNGSTFYSFSSLSQGRTDAVIVKDGVAVYERRRTPEYPDQLGYAKIDQFIQTYGQPEAVINGSKFYTDFASYYVYASKGFTVIANPYTKEVYEVQKYEPMAIESYRLLYGDDINEQKRPPEIFGQ